MIKTGAAMGITKKRDRSIDIAKGIAVLSVILGHHDISWIVRIVFTFHVPVFFLISGYFLSTAGDLKRFLYKKARTLIVPYYLTCFAMTILGALYKLYEHGAAAAINEAKEWIFASLYASGDSYTEPFPIKAIGAIWFLWAMFWANILLRVSLKMKPVNRIFFILILFLFGYFSPRYCWLPLSIQAGCCTTLWMYFGYMYKQSQQITNELSSESKYVILLFALVVWICFIKDYQSFLLVRCDFGRGIVDIFGSLCASCVVIQISKKMQSLRYIGSFLAFVGQYSLFMLCFHIIELNILPWKLIFGPLYDMGLPIFLIYLIRILAKYVFIILFTFVSSKNKHMRRLFGVAS